jgi:HAD superfamily hydrolase (TIGR01458 family)
MSVAGGRDVQGVLLDIDGVLLTSSKPLPGSAAAVAELRRSGVPVRFITNTTSVPAAEIAAALGQAGIDVGGGDLITAGVVTAEYLRRTHPGARCLVLNDGSSDDLVGIKMADPDDTGADVVVVGGGGPSFTWDELNVALTCLLEGAVLVAMHGTAMWRTAEGYCLDGGAYARMLEMASGVTATVVGKPSPQMFLAAATSLRLEPDQVMMVGDDLASDVLAAQELGMTGVLVRTGKFRPEVLERSEVQPDLVIESVAELPALFRDA